MNMLQDLGPLLEGVLVPPQQDAPVRAAIKALEAGRADEAARLLEGLWAIDNEPVVSYLLGVAHLQRADVYRAGPALDAALEGAPDLWPAHLARALVLELQHEFEAAADSLRLVLQARAEHVGAIAALARTYNELGKLDRAEALSRRGLELSAEHPGLLRALAGTLRRQDRHSEAVDVLRRLLDDHPDSPHDEASAVALGDSLLRLHRPAEARAIFEAVLRRDSESTGALAGMAEALQSEGRLSEAQGYLLRALAAAPEQGWLHLSHARLQARMGNASAAESSANMAASLDPEDGEALRIGLRASMDQRRFEEALRYADRLLPRAPEDALALAARAIARVLRGEAATVLSELTPRINGDRTPPDITLAVGCAQFALGRPRLAADNFVQVLRHREGDALAQRLLGSAYELVGNPTADALALLRVRMADPDVQSPDAGISKGADAANGPAGSRPSLPRATTWDSTRQAGRRVTGPIQPIVEVAVNALLAPDRTPGSVSARGAGAPIGPRAAPVHDLQTMPRNPTPAPSPMSPSHTPPSLGPEPAPNARRSGTGSIPAIAVLTSRGLAGRVPRRGANTATADEATESMGDAPDPISILTQVGERDTAELGEMLRRLHRLVTSDRALLSSAVALERIIEDLDQPMVLAILGPRGAGKTSFVNALIGREIIPPTTTVAHLLRYGRHPVGRILYVDGRIETIRFHDLSGFLAANASELVPEVVRLVEILCPIDELTKASILDVPEASIENKDDPLLASADAVVWLVGVDQPAQHWRDAARWLTERPMDAIAIVSRVEGHDPTQIESAVARAQMILGAAVKEVLTVSAKVAMSALQSGNVDDLRRAGIARLHRVLKREFFQRSSWIKARSGRARARTLLSQAQSQLEARKIQLEERQSVLGGLAARVALDRAQVRAEIEEDTPPRLRAAIERAVNEIGRELVDLLREHQSAAGREHVLKVLRAQVRDAVGDAVDLAREAVDARLGRLTEGYLDQLEAVFPIDEGSQQAQRILGLRGILDGFRQVLLEQSFGRYAAYLEGWIDQSPVHLIFEDAAAIARPDTLATALRTRGLRLDAAPLIPLNELGEPLFEGVAGFAEESLGELRVSSLELEKGLLEPMRAINLRDQERP